MKIIILAFILSISLTIYLGYYFNNPKPEQKYVKLKIDSIAMIDNFILRQARGVLPSLYFSPNDAPNVNLLNISNSNTIIEIKECDWEIPLNITPYDPRQHPRIGIFIKSGYNLYFLFEKLESKIELMKYEFRRSLDGEFHTETNGCFESSNMNILKMDPEYIKKNSITISFKDFLKLNKIIQEERFIPINLFWHIILGIIANTFLLIFLINKYGFENIPSIFILFFNAILLFLYFKNLGH